MILFQVESTTTNGALFDIHTNHGLISVFPHVLVSAYLKYPNCLLWWKPKLLFEVQTLNLKWSVHYGKGFVLNSYFNNCVKFSTRFQNLVSRKWMVPMRTVWLKLRPIKTGLMP